MKWSEPENMRAWSGRLFAVGPFVIFMTALFLLFTELRFDWVEQMIGDYLVKTNMTRPESGHIWEIDHKAQKAKQAVEQIVVDQLSIQRETLEAESMTEIARRMEPGQGVMMSPEHFRNVYLRLPSTISYKIMSPMELLTVFSGGKWLRTYCEKTENTLIVYLLGANNRVLRGMEIALGYLEQIDVEQAPFDGSLDELPEFRNQTIDAGLFFDTLIRLPVDVTAGILADPAVLLKLPGRLTRVGVPAEIADDPVTIGFEFEMNGKYRVIWKKALKTAVLQMNAAVSSNRKGPPDNDGDDSQGDEP